MPPYYIGGGANPYSGLGGGGSVGPIVHGPFTQTDGLNKPTLPGPRPKSSPIGPIGGPQTSSPNTAPAPNVLQAGAVRATGDPKGYDPSYLQNLATAIGGLFSRPQGNLRFNPLGDLSEISPSSGMSGNAPQPGLPSTWLQDALNGLAFHFAPPTPAPTRSAGGGGDNGRGRGGRMLNLQ